MQPFSRNNMLPGPLMNNNYSARFPYGSALPAKPNPLSSIQKPQSIPATAQGVQAAMNKVAKDTKPTKYKFDAAHHATGADAFKSLDNYMKKAGFNDFQSQFFSRLICAGLNGPQISQAVKQASVQFGSDVSLELQEGLVKLGISVLGGPDPVAAVKSVGNRLGNWFGGATQKVEDAGSAISSMSQLPSQMAEMQQFYKEFKAMNPMATFKDMQNMVAELKKNNTIGGINNIVNQGNSMANQYKEQGIGGLLGLGNTKDMGGMLQGMAPYLMLGALGGAGGMGMGGGMGGMMGGIGLPLMYYLMRQQTGGKDPFSNMFGSMFGTNQQTPQAQGTTPSAQGTTPTIPGASSLVHRGPAPQTQTLPYTGGPPQMQPLNNQMTPGNPQAPGMAPGAPKSNPMPTPPAGVDTTKGM